MAFVARGADPARLRDDEGTFTPLAVDVGHPMEQTRVWERVVWIKRIGHLASSVYDAAITVHEETS
ncbi:MAG: hypothetical protein NTU53_02760 [Planctomycetota bacterium]|nr:hypothetical protein [Planctomycetota bacterium]